MIMDYEKKYRNLVEAVKELQEANPSDDGIQNWIRDNVPELKESEDERIRKAIVLFFETQDESTTYSFIPKKDILAWLEKQKEFVSTGFKDVWEATDCEKLTAPLEKYSKDAIMKLCHAWYDKGIELERKKNRLKDK